MIETITTDVDIDRLMFPKHLAPHVGLSTSEITEIKNKGCPFLGKKSSLRWIRAWLDETSGAAPLLARSVRRRSSSESKSGVPAR